MTGFQSRVIDEHFELTLKINALGSFITSSIFKSLDPTNKELLRQQLDTMTAYKHILEKRIELF